MRRFSPLVILLAAPAFGVPVGVFTQAADVGQVSRPVGARVESGLYVVGAGGANIWGTHDDFGFVSKEARGDLSMSARIELQGPGAQPHRRSRCRTRAAGSIAAAASSASRCAAPSMPG